MDQFIFENIDKTFEEFYENNKDKIEFIFETEYETQSENIDPNELYNFCATLYDYYENNNKLNAFGLIDAFAYYNKNKATINKIFGQLGSTHIMVNPRKPVEILQPYKPRERISDSKKPKITFKDFADKPQIICDKPKRQKEIQDTTIDLTPFPYNNPRYEKIPSVDRSFTQYIIRKFLEDCDPEAVYYSGHFKPLQRENLYNKDIAHKFYGNRHTWMFDIMYFSNSRPKEDNITVNYLVGININTRYAVGRRIEDKSSKSLIKAIEDVMKEQTIKTIIFDGERGINSNDFESFVRRNNVNLYITKSGIHTQTAPIDRLCRTLRHYFVKWYTYSDPEFNRIIKEIPWFKQAHEREKTRRLIEIRKFFAKEGQSKNMISPIPIIKDGRDQFLDVIEYYNQKPHKGIQRIIDKACQLFKLAITVPHETLTPNVVHSNSGLEYLIVKYCQTYNNLIPQPKYNVGDKVNLWAVDKGNLRPGNKEEDINNPYEILKIHGNIYYVKSLVSGIEKWISIYFIK